MEEKFLIFEIKDCGRADGIVLIHNGCSVGNFLTIDDAKKYAIYFFMLQYPNVYAKSIMYKLMGMSGSYHEWFLFEKHVKSLGIEMPEEITSVYNMGNYTIGFKGDLIDFAILAK